MKIAGKIKELKKKLNAVILAHNYQLPEIQDIADYTGDSLALSIKASKTEADIIIFCGVRFMAETASIISPDKTVILPSEDAGCAMADMMTEDDLSSLQSEYPKAKTVCYVNSRAGVKAMSYICCTSGNVLEVINSIPEEDEIIFVPDRYLGEYASKTLNRKLIFGSGFCPSHLSLTGEDVLEAKERHPDAVVMVHPECSAGVIDLADRVLSTYGMSEFAKNSSSAAFIIGTEIGMLHRLETDNPGKNFYPVTQVAVCPTMKTITLDLLLASMEDKRYLVSVDNDIRERAAEALRRMLELPRSYMIN